MIQDNFRHLTSYSDSYLRWVLDENTTIMPAKDIPTTEVMAALRDIRSLGKDAECFHMGEVGDTVSMVVRIEECPLPNNIVWIQQDIISKDGIGMYGLLIITNEDHVKTIALTYLKPELWLIKYISIGRSFFGRQIVTPLINTANFCYAATEQARKFLSIINQIKPGQWAQDHETRSQPS